MLKVVRSNVATTNHHQNLPLTAAGVQGVAFREGVWHCEHHVRHLLLMRGLAYGGFLAGRVGIIHAGIACGNPAGIPTPIDEVADQPPAAEANNEGQPIHPD
jgi:hypothetical protein